MRHPRKRQPEDQRHEAQPAADNDRQPYQDQQPPLPPGRGAALAKQPRMSRVQQASAAPAAAQQGRRQPQLAGPIGEGGKPAAAAAAAAATSKQWAAAAAATGKHAAAAAAAATSKQWAAAAAATGKHAAAAAAAAAAGKQLAAAAAASGPPKLDVTRVFSWQEKVPGRREVWEAAQHTAAAAAAAAQTTAQLGAEGAAQGPGQLGGQGGRGRRTRALGSQTSGGEQQGGRRTTLAAAGAHGEGSLLFTYVHSDEFCDQEELSKTVTTSNYEHENPLYNRLMSNPKHRQEVLNFRTMYIMASLGPEEEIPDPQYDRVLVCIKAYPDGSFDMRPGFSRPGRKYRFEDALGGIYEYRVEDVSAKAEPSLARRTAALQRQVAARALELRKLSIGAARFQPPPSDQQSMRLVLLGELLGCADFTRDRLYLEYSLRFDPALWEMATTSWAAHEPGLYKVGMKPSLDKSAGLAALFLLLFTAIHKAPACLGVTACSRMTQYPPDPELGGPGRWVAHWGHPLEAELVSRGEPPPPAKYPALFFQVCSYDLRDRYTSQGYGWLGLAPFVPGSHTQYVQCWRPLASLRDQQQEFFIGGSVELQDVNYLERGHMGGGSCPPPPLKHATSQGQQSGGKGNAPHLLNKYGLRTETTGVIKVRLHALTQRWDAATEEALQGGAMGREGEAGAGSLTAAPFATRTPSKRNKRDLSLAAVVERARSRLKDARGGDVALRPGVVSAAPGIRRGPQDCRVQEGAMVELRVEAVGMEPLRYQWYRDDRKLTVATADSDILIIAEARPLDAGAYHCQVSNKDGAVNSPKAMVKVDKLPRMARASGAYAAHDEARSVKSQGARSEAGVGPSPSGPAARPSLAPRVGRLQGLNQRLEQRAAARQGQYQMAAGDANEIQASASASMSGPPGPAPGPHDQLETVPDAQTGSAAELGPNGLRRKPSRAASAHDQSASNAEPSGLGQHTNTQSVTAPEVKDKPRSRRGLREDQRESMVETVKLPATIATNGARSRYSSKADSGDELEAETLMQGVEGTGWLNSTVQACR
ncbi:hypothetical protein QJQ45_018610 [Haematococcus lacustris]|nr:hypothetical protein QJQ45_018610 [Haematococcus lacustris]